jgi:hypothetical protein
MNTDAALTSVSGLEIPWLSNSLNVPPRDAQGGFSGSLKSKGKSWKLSRSIRTSPQSWFCSKTRPLSPSTSIPASLSSLNCQIGRQATGAASNDGDLYTQNSPWFHGKDEPAERRVLSSDIVATELGFRFSSTSVTFHSLSDNVSNIAFASTFKTTACYRPIIWRPNSCRRKPSPTEVLDAIPEGVVISQVPLCKNDKSGPPWPKVPWIIASGHPWDSPRWIPASLGLKRIDVVLAGFGLADDFSLDGALSCNESKSDIRCDTRSFIRDCNMQPMLSKLPFWSGDISYSSLSTLQLIPHQVRLFLDFAKCVIGGFDGFFGFPPHEAGETCVNSENSKRPFLKFKLNFFASPIFFGLGYFFISKGWRRVVSDKRGGTLIVLSGFCCIWFSMWLIFYAG